MTTWKTLIGLGAAALAASPALADPPAKHSLSLRNETGGRLECGVRKEGSSIADGVTLKAGQVWTQSYDGQKPRWLRCEGVYSDWQRLTHDSSYTLVKAGAERVVARALAR